MQTSGTAPGLSDGVKKTIVGATAPRATGTVRPDPPKPKASSHRAGGHAKHTRRSQ